MGGREEGRKRKREREREIKKKERERKRKRSQGNTLLRSLSQPWKGYLKGSILNLIFTSFPVKSALTQDGGRSNRFVVHDLNCSPGSPTDPLYGPWKSYSILDPQLFL